MRYNIVSIKDGKVLMTAPDIDSAGKVMTMMGPGYKIVPVEKSTHTRQFNRQQ